MKLEAIDVANAKWPQQATASILKILMGDPTTRRYICKKIE
jgi:hypothetical protein